MNVRGKFVGTMVWESDFIDIFKQMLIPSSFYEKKYPFIQYRLPQFPTDIIIEQEEIEDPETKEKQLLTRQKYLESQ